MSHPNPFYIPKNIDCHNPTQLQPQQNLKIESGLTWPPGKILCETKNQNENSNKTIVLVLFWKKKLQVMPSIKSFHKSGDTHETLERLGLQLNVA